MSRALKLIEGGHSTRGTSPRSRIDWRLASANSAVSFVATSELRLSPWHRPVVYYLPSSFFIRPIFR